MQTSIWIFIIKSSLLKIPMFKGEKIKILATLFPHKNKIDLTQLREITHVSKRRSATIIYYRHKITHESFIGKIFKPIIIK